MRICHLKWWHLVTQLKSKTSMKTHTVTINLVQSHVHSQLEKAMLQHSGRSFSWSSTTSSWQISTDILPLGPGKSAPSGPHPHWRGSWSGGNPAQFRFWRVDILSVLKMFNMFKVKHMSKVQREKIQTIWGACSLDTLLCIMFALCATWRSFSWWGRKSRPPQCQSSGKAKCLGGVWWHLLHTVEVSVGWGSWGTSNWNFEISVLPNKSP